MKKSLKLKNKNRKLILIASIMGAVLAIFAFKQIFAKPKIAVVGQPTTCTSNIATFSASEGCTGNTYRIFEVSCKNGSSRHLGSTTECRTQYSAYSDAQNFCGTTCQTSSPVPATSTLPLPTPSISPSLSPSPRASILPSPSSTSLCFAQTVVRYAMQDPCTQYSNPSRWSQINFNCGGESTIRITGTHGLCYVADSLIIEAKKVCARNSCAVPSVSPVASAISTPISSPIASPLSQTIRKCYGWGRVQWCRNVRVN